jgi:uncharacterized protein YbbC (DUF1343 family)
MTKTGLEIISKSFPKNLKGKRIGLLCHAASITSNYTHAVDVFLKSPCKLCAIFGPQHGMYGQTQDNMIEWEGFIHPVLKIPVYSLYGKTRKPTKESLLGLDAFIIDLQDVGARPYTYIWTAKLCLEACAEHKIPVWVLDRPNPISAIKWDGPILKEEYFSFVGGACIPMTHRLTLGEICKLLKLLYFPNVELNIVWMKDWWRNSLWTDTKLPWVMPSPNMPCFETSIVYPGMVLLEATNMSEGRGTTRPFEIIGAPYFNADRLIKELKQEDIKGCIFRRHDFIPTFQKWHNVYCNGIQIHITNCFKYEPVLTTAVILQKILKISDRRFLFKEPPYEYEKEKKPFDILSGDTSLRQALLKGKNLKREKEKWIESYKEFKKIFIEIINYKENY